LEREWGWEKKGEAEWESPGKESLSGE